tara:strand:- start:12886 stop:13458 length:573 start_codon:yes stop_codon:yes gene_type:complete
MSTATLTGLDSTLALLDQLGKRGDAIARQASTEAANDLRNNWMARQLSSHTGISRTIVQKHMAVKRANQKYLNARINFSGAGILVRDYSYTKRVVSTKDNRAQILVDWVGGQKVAAGFINPRGRSQVPLSTRNQKTTKTGKTYTYRRGQMVEAMGPSLASVYLALPEDAVQRQAQVRLAERVTTLLAAII